MKRILLLASILCLWLSTPAQAKQVYVPVPPDAPIRASLMPQVERWRAAVAEGDRETLLSYAARDIYPLMHAAFRSPGFPEWLKDYDTDGILRKLARSASARPVLFNSFVRGYSPEDVFVCLREPGPDGTVPEAPPAKGERCPLFWSYQGAWYVGYPRPPLKPIYRRIPPSNPQYPELANAAGRWAHAVAARDIPTLIAFAWPDAQEPIRKALADSTSDVYRNLLADTSPIRNLFTRKDTPFVMYNRGEPANAHVDSFRACFYDPARADISAYPDENSAWDALHAKDAKSPKRPDDGTSDVYCHDFIDMDGWRANYEYEGVIFGDPSTYQNDDEDDQD